MVWMDKIFPDEVIRNIYKYDCSYKEIFDKVLIQLNMHCFIYRCSECYITIMTTVTAIVKPDFADNFNSTKTI